MFQIKRLVSQRRIFTPSLRFRARNQNKQTTRVANDRLCVRNRASQREIAKLSATEQSGGGPASSRFEVEYF